MNIISLQYVLLVAVSLMVYWAFPVRYKYIVLLITSGIFIFRSNNIELFFIMYFMIFVAWCAGILFYKLNNNSKFKIAILIIALIIEAGLLYGVRIINAFLDIANYFLNTTSKINILLPVGVSYFSLSIIGYMLDVYWGTVSPEKNFLKFCTFGSYYPLLTSGPIVRYAETEQQIFEKKEFEFDSFLHGIERIIWGVFKKMVIADRLSIVVNTVYADFSKYTGMYVWLAALFFLLQLYTDFSGCIDIICGVSKLYGINLPENFDMPFVSRSVSEWWRRWHITLGAWLRDYILYPILKSKLFQQLAKKTKKKFGKKYGKKIPVWFGLFISWFLIGTWHGGGWNYIIGVGIFQWILIVMGELLAPLYEKINIKLHVNQDDFGFQFMQSVVTCFFLMVSNAMFRCTEGMKQVIEMFKSAFKHSDFPITGVLQTVGLSPMDINILIIAIFILILFGIIKYITQKDIFSWINNQFFVFRYLFNWIMIFMIIMSLTLDLSEFLYAKF